MISVEEAKKRIFKNTRRLKVQKIKLINSLRYILAENIYSPIDIPGFDNSAMDGYALREKDIKNYKKLKVIGEISAGVKPNVKINKGEAVRINTGAAIPEGADSILIKEDTIEKRGWLYIRNLKSHISNLKSADIRRRGSEISKGELVFKTGTIMTPSLIGCLSSMGFQEVCVFGKPSVSVIVTGNELRKPGRKLKPGQIYDSNTAALISLLEQARIDKKNIVRLRDNESAIRKAFFRIVRRSDVVIFTGGISAGNRDYVKKILKVNNVKKIFHKVAQKPGKPLYFGRYKNALIFGLPGNSAASIICFYEYVLPVLRKLQGYDNIELTNFKLPLLNKIKLPEGKASFLKGKLFNGGVRILKGQESYKLSSLAKADCLVYVPERKRRLAPGENVVVHKLI